MRRIRSSTSIEVACACPKGVDYGLPADTQRLIAQDRMQRTARSFDNHTECDFFSIADTEFPLNAGKFLLDVQGFCGSQTQTFNRIPTLANYLGH